MADSLVSFAIEKLGKVLEDEVASLLGVTKELRKLSSAFTSIKAILEDAENRYLKEQSVKDWLKKLKDVAYDIDDILDECTTESLPSQDDEGDESLSCNKKVQNFLSPFSCFSHVAFRHKLANRIKDTWERLKEIDSEKNRFEFKMGNSVRMDEIEDRETSSKVDESEIIGREDDKNGIRWMLLNETSNAVNEVPIVISIIGMGGLGKTTLAQLAYNDEDVKRHFDMRMWVCVSNNFDVKQITKSIIESATGSSCESLALDPLQDSLQGMLQAKKFLLVLDDVWSDDSRKWGTLRNPFKAGASGSRIIVTTRLEDVVSTMGSTHRHELRALSDDECWSLFKSEALEHRSAEERLELEAIGREIVKKCKGVPLAAKMIGSAMRSRKTRSQWNLVLGSDVWNSGDVLGRILPALFLSYQDLSPALKQCFTYCSVFPKDMWLEKHRIVKLWAAQGFIRSDESGEIEETGGLYFDDLLRRSLLQDAEFDDYKNILRCKMHDLVHDLAQFVSGSDCSTVEIRRQTSSNLKNIHHSFLIFSDEAGEVASTPATLYKAQKLRTLVVRDSRIIGVPPQNLFHHLRYLRALDLSGTRIQKLSRTIGQLKHLRYLDLSYTEIVELPEEVSDCRNLQTLRLCHCGKLEKLPRGLRKMNNLRHLEIEGTRMLKSLPQGIGILTGLRTLTEFTVGGGDEGWNCRELKYLNHLQGSLGIKNVEKVRSRDEAREAELDKKQHLHALTLQYGNDQRLDDGEDMLEILKPHTNSKEYIILFYKGSKLPKWIEDPVFSNLVRVELICCDGCKQLPGLGKLPSLKYLRVLGMKEVRKVGGEFSGDANNDGSDGVVSFPKLETLLFLDMPNLEEWELREGDGQVMPSLVELSVTACPKLKALPHNLPPFLQRLSLGISNDGMSSEAPLPIFPNLNHLEIWGNDEMTSLPGGWLGQLKALQTLKIHYCNRMESLPEELQHLTKLQQLKIGSCRVLEERYGDGGEDRDKIANIPSIKIGWKI